MQLREELHPDESFDIDRARADTRACEDVIHFNNAGAALMPVPVCEALHAYLDAEELAGGYETAARQAEALDCFYPSAAKLLNCSTDEIAYVENATRAWDQAFYAFTFKPGDKILTSQSEYGSNVIAYLQQARRYGAEVVFVPNDDYGQIDVQSLADRIDDRVKLISISHIPTGGGLVNPAKQVGQIAKASGIPYILDSCQGAGQIPLNVEEIGCDVLSATGRKYLRGPRGTGLLYVRKALLEKLEPPMLDIRAARLLSPHEYELQPNAKRFENWEQYFAGKLALGKAMQYALSWGLEAIQKRVYWLADTLRRQLASIDGVTVTDEGREKCGIVTFTVRQKTATQIKSLLAARKINVSISHGSGSLVPFHNRGISEVVRASVHYYNTEEEIDYFIDALKIPKTKRLPAEAGKFRSVS